MGGSVAHDVNFPASPDFWPAISHWPFLPVLSRIGLAVAVGIFVGLEREHSQKTGVRTFALTALFCCLGGLMGHAYATLALAFVAVAVAAMNYREMVKTQKLALTTTAGLTVVGFAGVLFGQGHVFTPAVAGILTAALFAWKESISRFSDVISHRELRSAILLAILTFIIFPILPDHPVDPWGLVEPRSNWASVIVIAGIGFINYILMRLFGARGLEITAFFGGLVNSRKVIVELGLRLKDAGRHLADSVQRGIMLATGAMLIRNLLLVGVLASSAIIACSLPFGLMLIVSLALWWRSRGAAQTADANVDLSLSSPFRLRSALEFGLVFLAINVTGALAQRNFGAESFYFVSIIGGFLSSASSIAAAADLMARGEIPQGTAVNGIVLATLTSVLVNIPLAHGLMPDARLKRRASVGLGLIATAGLVGIAVSELL